MTTTVPRGIRNNNPGNIRIGDKWQGLMAPADMSAAQKREHAARMARLRGDEQ